MITLLAKICCTSCKLAFHTLFPWTGIIPLSTSIPPSFLSVQTVPNYSPEFLWHFNCLAGAAQILAWTVTRLFYVLCFASKAVRLPWADSACLNSSLCSQRGAWRALCPEQIFLKCLLTDTTGIEVARHEESAPVLYFRHFRESLGCRRSHTLSP